MAINAASIKTYFSRVLFDNRMQLASGKTLDAFITTLDLAAITTSLGFAFTSEQVGDHYVVHVTRGGGPLETISELAPGVPMTAPEEATAAESLYTSAHVDPLMYKALSDLFFVWYYS